MLGNLKKLFTITSDQRWLLIEAVLLLFTVKILLIIFPIRIFLKTSNKIPNKSRREPDLVVLKNIKWALQNADRLAFWKNRCLVQSLAGRWMLQRKGIPVQLSFGIKHDEKKIIHIHAWLKVRNFEVVAIAEDYEEILTV